MINEFDQRRAPAPRPYVPSGARLYLPEGTQSATRDLLRASRGHEACVFWYGRREGGDGTVLAVRAPAQISTRFNYHVDEVAMSRMTSTLEDGWRPLAQVHSHPGRDVEHSRFDDAMISSRRILSLVFASYGFGATDWPRDVGVHEWQEGYWHLLAPTAAHERVVLVPGSVNVEDLR